MLRKVLAKGVLVVLLLCLLAAAPARGQHDEEDGGDEGDGEEEPVDESKVLELTPDSLATALKDHQYLMVQFYAPWCGHCKAMKPDYARAAITLADEEPKIALGKVDATKYEDLTKEYNIEGFPTLKWFVDGKMTSKDPMARGEEEIVKWCKKNSGDPAKPITAAATFTELQEKQFSSVAFLEKGSGKEYDLIMKLAGEDDKNDYFVVTDKALAKEQGVGKFPSLVFYRNFEEKKVIFDGKFEEESIKQGVKKNMRPPVIAMTDDTAQMIFDNETPKMLLFRPEAALADYTAVAKEDAFVGEFVFATVGADGDPELGEYIGISKESKLPELFAYDVVTNKKFRMEKEVNKANLMEFIKAYQAGKLQPHLKSAPVIEGWDSEPVKSIVASQWDTVVKDPTKHVLVEIYAPWCGHCQKLEPKYNKAAAHLEGTYDDVVLVKMDGTTNEVEGVEVQGFPMMIAFPKDAKDAGQDLSSDAMKDTKTLVREIKKIFDLKEVKKEGEEEYELAAKRFKLAVKKLKGSLLPAAQQLNLASDALEKLQG